MNNITRYPGIPPFMPEQKDVFFGRSADTQRLYNLVLTEKTVLLQAKSGLGKSSIINAGLLPLLQENRQAAIFSFRFGNYTTQSLAPVQNMVNTLMQNREVGSFLDMLIPNENSLYYHFKTLQAQNPAREFYLIFDQFEELFTYPNEQVFTFKKQLAEALHGHLPKHFQIMLDRKRNLPGATLPNEQELKLLDSTPNICILFAIRADRLSELEQIADYLPQILRHRFELKPLNREQIVEAIVQPAHSTSSFNSPVFDYDNQTVQTIVNYLTNNNTLPAETTQLQIVCQKFEKMAMEKGEGFRVQNEHLPDFKDVFIEFYRDSIAQIAKDKQKVSTVFIEDHLIATGHRISLDKLVCLTHIDQTNLDTLEKNHLLRAERNSTGGTSYELAHDTLVAPILEVRKARIEREEEERTEKERLEELRLAHEKAEQERIEREKERKRQRTIILIVGVAAVISFVFAIFAFIQMQKAKELTYKISFKDAMSYYDKEEFSVALDKFKYMRDSIGGFDENAIEERIAACKSMDSTKEIFYNNLQWADSLLKQGIDSLVLILDIYEKTGTLNYKPGEKQLNFRIQAVKNQKHEFVLKCLDNAKIFEEAGYSNKAREVLLQAKQLEPDNKDINRLLNGL